MIDIFESLNEERFFVSTFEDVVAGMQDNVEDEDFDRQLKDMTVFATALGTKVEDVIMCRDNDIKCQPSESVYTDIDGIRKIREISKKRDYAFLYTYNDITFVVEVFNYTPWLYFKNEDQADTVLTAISGQNDEEPEQESKEQDKEAPKDEPTEEKPKEEKQETGEKVKESLNECFTDRYIISLAPENNTIDMCDGSVLDIESAPSSDMITRNQMDDIYNCCQDRSCEIRKCMGNAMDSGDTDLIRTLLNYLNRYNTITIKLGEAVEKYDKLAKRICESEESEEQKAREEAQKTDIYTLINFASGTNLKDKRALQRVIDNTPDEIGANKVETRRFPTEDEVAERRRRLNQFIKDKQGRAPTGAERKRISNIGKEYGSQEQVFTEVVPYQNKYDPNKILNISLPGGLVSMPTSVDEIVNIGNTVEIKSLMHVLQMMKDKIIKDIDTISDNKSYSEKARRAIKNIDNVLEMATSAIDIIQKNDADTKQREKLQDLAENWPEKLEAIINFKNISIGDTITDSTPLQKLRIFSRWVKDATGAAPCIINNEIRWPKDVKDLALGKDSPNYVVDYSKGDIASITIPTKEQCQEIECETWVMPDERFYKNPVARARAPFNVGVIGRIRQDEERPVAPLITLKAQTKADCITVDGVNFIRTPFDGVYLYDGPEIKHVFNSQPNTNGYEGSDLQDFVENHFIDEAHGLISAGTTAQIAKN